ncbi:hypothetical protein DFH08DRAFT_963451 [Mycena albidolilacea]|uniref:Uncharacterized protein n=1 Tax=Mycena albidolilacea TaxID=1033008 RepID=A0AAD6ZVR0_9AGAR|nr:hypothetical protein DFH08DRAFT_963451 [Mycena albidolilacea]
MKVTGWQCKQVAKAAHKNFKRKGTSNHAHFAAIPPESVASPSDAVSVASENSEEVFQVEALVEVVAVTEDVFMPDYDKFKDEDDDAAAGALFAMSNGEEVVVM